MATASEHQTSEHQASDPPSHPASHPPQLHVESTGAGPALVLSHGVGSDTAVWATVTAKLASRFTVVAWDQPGHGQSAALAEASGYGPRLAYACLEQVAAPFDDVVLVGHSLGGYLSARYAIDHPARVAALVLLATGPGFRSPDSRAKWNADVRRMAEKQGRPETLVGLHEDAHVIDHLRDIACPSLVIVGDGDQAFFGATDYIEQRIPGIERVTLADAGHMAPATHGEEIAELVLDFLTRRGVGLPS